MGFLTAICLTALAAALFRMLVPENTAAKQVSLLIACVFLLTALGALSKADISLTENSFDIGESADYISLSDEVNKKLQKQICGEMSEKVTAILNEAGFFPKQVHIIVNISGLYGIDITQVKLVFAKGEGEAAEAATRLISGELPKDIKITWELTE